MHACHRFVMTDDVCCVVLVSAAATAANTAAIDGVRAIAERQAVMVREAPP